MSRMPSLLAVTRPFRAVHPVPGDSPRKLVAPGRLRWILRIACGGAGIVFALAAPPVDAIASLWIGMMFLAVALFRDEYTPGRPARLEGAARGLAFGAGANLAALRFVPDVVARFTPLPRSAGIVALVLLAFFEGLRWAVAGWATRAAIRAGAPRALAFAAGVFVGSFVPTVFPWTAAGGATPWPVMIQLAEFVGERGVTFSMALAAGFAAEACLAGSVARRASRFALGISAPAIVAIFGQLRITEIEARAARAPRARIAVVQPSIDAVERWRAGKQEVLWRKLAALTADAEAAGAELTVWPEAAYPFPVDHGATRLPPWQPTLEGAGVRGPVLAGLISKRGDDTYNSAALIAPDGTLGDRQDKVHLLWFGETIPFLDRIAWVRSAFARGIGLSAGTGVSILASGRIRATVLNCFEDTLPDAGREAAAPGPNLLVNVTNDAWFVDRAGGPGERIESRESELHLRLAALRAVEARRDLVRAVNVGVTSWVDATGRVRARYAGATARALLVEPALLEGTTVYTALGDFPLGALLVASVAALLLKRRTRGAGSAEVPHTVSPSRDERAG